MLGKVFRVVHRGASRETAIQTILSRLGIDGGPGSGNFGHSGRPGKVGGSGKGGGSAFRTQSSKGSYVGIQRAKAFKSIAKQARAAKDVKAFVKSFSKEQYDQFVAQYHSCGTKEDITAYTERVMNLMKKQKPDKFPAPKVVDGKDLTDSYKAIDEPFTDPTTGQIIDEEIESAMYQQGFLGLPKVVSQEEFDKITAEHPEMPLLYRSYSAKDKEQLQDYDDQLEHGEWYVDCGTGGAGYGQGMYCAGVYQQEPLYKWNDPKLKKDFDMMHDVGKAGWVVFTDAKGDGYTTKEKLDPDSADELYAGIPYLIVNEDGSRSMIRMDDEAYLWTDMNTGEILDDDKANEIVMRATDVYECKDQDIGIYKDANEKERKHGIAGAMDEMDHYRHVSESRVLEETLPEPPEGKTRASHNDTHYFYDMKNMTPAVQKKPEDGMLIAVMNPQNMKDFEKYGASVFKVDGNRLVYPDGEKTSIPLTVDDLEDYQEWAEIEGECEKPKLDPTSSTRLMTLDPSAKIITLSELSEIRSKGYRIREDAKEQMRSELGSFLENLSFDDQYYESKIYYGMMGENVGNLTSNNIKMIDEYKEKNPDRVAEIQKLAERHKEQREAAIEKARRYDKIQNLDPGVAATILGYDAINAEGHGGSGSYTVVLNRTKLIISEQRVDTRR